MEWIAGAKPRERVMDPPPWVTGARPSYGPSIGLELDGARI